MIAVTPPSFRRERALIKRGVWPVAGCDEAGRGPLAGPVVAAAVVLDPKRIPKGIDDSKRLIAGTPRGAVRADLRDLVLRGGLRARRRESTATTSCAPRCGRWRARWRRCRRRRNMSSSTAATGIDAPCDCEAVIGGDGLVVSIAAASIIAKVTRDRLMCALAQDCPGYGFESAQGLRRARASRGARTGSGRSAHHRSLFAPVVAAREQAARRTRSDAERDRRADIVDVGIPAASDVAVTFFPAGIARNVMVASAARRALSHLARSNSIGLRGAGVGHCRTVHAFHLPDYRTDPRPAAAGGLDRGAAAGRALAGGAAAAVPQPAGELATVLAFGREYQVGTDLGPPLAFWLADIAFRAAGNHLFGVYLLAQLCSIATFLALYQLARAIVGGQQAVLAVLLTMTVTVFGSPGARIRPAGAGASAVGAAVAAFLAIDRPEPAQCLVCLVDRSRAAAADDPGRASACCCCWPGLRWQPRAAGAR